MCANVRLSKSLPRREVGQIDTKVREILFYHLEFARLYDSTSPVSYLEYINTPVKFFEINSDASGHFGQIIYFLTHKIEDLYSILAIRSFAKLESDHSACRVRIKFYQVCRGSQGAGRRSDLSK